MNHAINNDEDAVSTDPYLLTPPIDDDFSCADFNIDDSFESETTTPYIYMGNEVPAPPPPPALPLMCVPEMTFTSASKTPK